MLHLKSQQSYFSGNNGEEPYIVKETLSKS